MIKLNKTKQLILTYLINNVIVILNLFKNIYLKKKKWMKENEDNCSITEYWRDGEWKMAGRCSGSSWSRASWSGAARNWRSPWSSRRPAVLPWASARPGAWTASLASACRTPSTCPGESSLFKTRPDSLSTSHQVYLSSVKYLDR